MALGALLDLVSGLLDLLGLADGVANAVAHDREQRARRTRRGRSADRRLQDVAERLRCDVEGTLGSEYGEVVEALAANLGSLHVRNPGAKLVEDVQQHFMDTFVDTTWPACPRHPTHPLWCDDARWWRCERDRVKIARLGELVASTRGTRGRSR